MSSPTPPPAGRLPGLVAHFARRAHGIRLKSVASAFTFVVIGFIAITIKNVVFAGLSLEESLFATFPTLLVKGALGYYYPAIRDPILERVREGVRRLLAESLAYAVLQTTSFTLVVMFLIPFERLPQAILGTFVTSLFMGKLVGVIIDKLTRVLIHARTYLREELQ